MRNSTRKKRKIIFAVMAALILFLVISVLSLNLTEITVTGNERYTEEEIVEVVFGGKWDRNLAYCYYKNRWKEHEMIPFVEDYKIVFQGIHKAEVIVYEKRVVGYVTYMSSYMYFDKDGIIVESTNKKLDGIPWVTGLKFGHIVLFQPLPIDESKIFDEILNLTQSLFAYELKVDKIQFDNHQNVTLWMGDIEVILGGNRDINGKIGVLHDIFPKLENLSGTLYLDTYNEADSNIMYTFKKK